MEMGLGPSRLNPILGSGLHACTGSQEAEVTASPPSPPVASSEPTLSTTEDTRFNGLHPQSSRGLSECEGGVHS